MTFYLIGLGLDLKSISVDALDIIKKCKKVYLEDYTVDFPYKNQELEKSLGIKIEKLNREQVEKEKFLDDAKNKDICLLVYGSPLTATTHISLVLKCKKERINLRILYNSSILDAIAETGLQAYKFGKITNITKHESESFFKIIEENKICEAHSLILLDIGLKVSDALKKLEEMARKRNFKLKEIVICSCLGTKKAIMKYGKIEKLAKENFKLPACIIIPGKLHFIEKEALESLGK